MTEPLVSICCLCYNHEPYIRECLEGFMMQKTNFAFEVLIHDDASTDKSAEIIREYEAKYPDIIKPIYQTENQYSKGVGVTRVYQFPRAKGKYIAMCEGDDYWTDPYKLQKQVGFLEANEDYSICSHRYKILEQETGILESDFNSSVVDNKKNGFSFDLDVFFQGWYIHTLTVLFRKSALKIEFLSTLKYPSDYMLFYSILKSGKAYLFGFEGAVYRKHSGGLYTSNPPLKQSYILYDCLKDLHSIENTSITEKNFNFRIKNYIKSYIRHSPKMSYKYLFNLLGEFFRTTNNHSEIIQFWKMLFKSLVKRHISFKIR